MSDSDLLHQIKRTLDDLHRRQIATDTVVFGAEGQGGLLRRVEEGNTALLKRMDLQDAKIEQHDGQIGELKGFKKTVVAWASAASFAMTMGVKYIFGEK